MDKRTEKSLIESVNRALHSLETRIEALEARHTIGGADPGAMLRRSLDNLDGILGELEKRFVPTEPRDESTRNELSRDQHLVESGVGLIRSGTPLEDLPDELLEAVYFRLWSIQTDREVLRKPLQADGRVF